MEGKDILGSQLHGLGVDDPDTAEAGDGVSRNDEDILQDPAGEVGAYGLADTKGCLFAPQAKGVFNARDGEEFEGIGVEGALCAQDAGRPLVAGVLDQSIPQGDGEGRVVGVLREGDVGEAACGDRQAYFAVVGCEDLAEGCGRPDGLSDSHRTGENPAIEWSGDPRALQVALGTGFLCLGEGKGLPGGLELGFTAHEGTGLVLVSEVLPVEPGLFRPCFLLIEVELGAGNLSLG